MALLRYERILKFLLAENDKNSKQFELEYINWTNKLEAFNV